MSQDQRDWIRVDLDHIPEENRKIADAALAMQLLAGYPPDGPLAIGPVAIKYPAKNSAEERRGREALARIVRDQMRGFVGELLALSIDPRTPSAIPGMTPTRRTQFETPGRPSQWARDLMIVDFIRRERFHFTGRRWKQEAAVQGAADKFNVSRSAVQAAWTRYEKLVGRRKASK
jgi:hypothetical protein